MAFDAGGFELLVLRMERPVGNGGCIVVTPPQTDRQGTEQTKRNKNDNEQGMGFHREPSWVLDGDCIITSILMVENQ